MTTTIHPTHHLLFWLMATLHLVLPGRANASESVVRAVLFYSPSCGHCHKVMTEDLPPLLENYGQRLEIVAVDTSHPQGQVLYQAAIEHFGIPPERRGVPTLIVGEDVLVGSLEIPQEFPLLVEAYMQLGGVDWPAVPGFAEALSSSESEAEAPDPPPTEQPEVTAAAPAGATEPTDPAMDPVPDPAEQTTPSDNPSAVSDVSSAGSNNVVERFRQDIVGNSLSVIILLGMIAVVIKVSLDPGAVTSDGASTQLGGAEARLVPLLILIGLLVSAYMAYVETTQVMAVCGPVGDCNTVQQSDYARLFGLVPIGIIGIAGYVALGAAWALATFSEGSHARWGRLLLVGMALVGTLFSIYLTFLEPFVIGATCMWCLTSAVAITLILLFSADGWRALLVAPSSSQRRRRWQGSQT